MVNIVRSSKYNARAIEKADIKKKKTGYNISYPIMNTIEITNLFITGGEIEIHIERSGKSKWSYNKKEKILCINHLGVTETWKVTNTAELIDAMNEYYDQNSPELIKENCETNIKKSQAKIGNQNAKKSSPLILQKNELGIHTDNNGNPIQFCQWNEYRDKYKNDIDAYYDWLSENQWVHKISFETQKALENEGYDIKIAQQNEARI